MGQQLVAPEQYIVGSGRWELESDYCRETGLKIDIGLE